MSTTADAVRTRPAILTRTAVMAGTLGVIVVILAAATWLAWGDLGQDTGYDSVAGLRLAHGSFPYVDYTYLYGPLGPAVIGLADWVGGDGLGPSLAVGLLLTVAIIAATFMLARRISSDVGGLLAGAITAGVAFAPTNYSFVNPHSFSEPLAILAALTFLIGVTYRASGAGERWLVVAGAAAGLACLTRPEFVVAIGIAAIAWTVTGARGTRGRDAVILAIPAIAIPAVVYSAFALFVDPYTLFLRNVYPVDELHASSNRVIALSAPLTGSSFVHLAIYVAAYTAGAALLVTAGRAYDRPRWRMSVIALVVLVGCGLVVLLAARVDTVVFWLRYGYAWIPAGAVAAAIAVAVRHRRAPSGIDRGLLATAVILGVIAVKTYAAFFPYSDVPQSAAYAVPFAAVFLARLHLVELGRSRGVVTLGALWLAFLALAGGWITIDAARAHSVAVSGAGGTIRATAREGHAYKRVLDLIDRQTRPGDAVLLAPQMTALYGLSNRTDPVPSISLLPGALPTVADQVRLIAQLKASDVRFVAIDQRKLTEYGESNFGGSFDRVLAAWIHRSFTHTATVKSGGTPGLTVEIWVRRPK